jgi:hypothetical protein
VSVLAVIRNAALGALLVLPLAGARPVVIGNPSVADGTLQTGGLLVVTGKNYGATNLIALDGRGQVLVEHNITVAAPKDGRLTVWRGAARESWSCAPRCERATVLGDAPEFFESAAKQAEARSGQAVGQPTQSPPR